MSVLSRSALESSPLADLHAIASELGIDGFRRLRKADLVDAIVAHQGGDGDEDETVSTSVVDAAAAEPAARPRRRRGGRGRGGDADGDADTDAGVEDAEVEGDLVKVEGDAAADDDEGPRERPGRRGRDRDRGRERDGDREERVAEGVVELLANGSGFVRLTPPEPSDDDVYISPAQVRRCELMSGDRVSGPARRPRRSERHPSLVRVDTINGAPAEEIAEGTPYDELRCGWPSERIALDGDEPTLKAIEWLTPIGRGSRVTITGGPRAGKSEALRRIAGALKGRDELELSVVLAGVRPEEAAEWAADGPVEPAAALTLSAGSDAQAQAVERVIDTAKRVAARGGHAVVLVDSLDALTPAAARRALGAARAIVDGGTLTVIAASTLPVGGETTVVALDAALAGAGRFPALDLAASGTLRAERLVGEDGARAIADAHAEALGQRGT
ncbi:MAG TPA: Rho termination factor N-terminal domain-containing protein [Solirubrobacteraceae bacterium]|nr:Rho termination factor N-terminal domain-containing protein [Solirubrobacteraceae bacterium]